MKAFVELVVVAVVDAEVEVDEVVGEEANEVAEVVEEGEGLKDGTSCGQRSIMTQLDAFHDHYHTAKLT